MRRANPTNQSRRAANALRSAGFPFVVEAVSPTDRAGGVVLDAVAYDVVDRDLELTTAVVTATSGKGFRVERALSDLATARDVLGTSNHYIVADGQWLIANQGLTSATEVAAPKAAHASRYDGGRVFVGDEDVLTELLRARLRTIAEGMRSTGFDAVTATSGLLEELRSSGLRVGSFVVDPDPAALWLALTSTVRSAAERRKNGLENVSSGSVANAVAELLGPLHDGTAHDPFCGLGSFLWAVGSRAAAEGVHLDLTGRELNRETARLARAVASFASRPVRIESGDSLSIGVVAAPRFNYIVSAPPMGLVVQPDQAIVGPLRAKRLETVAIMLAAESLVDGGRAVLHLSNSWLFNADASEVRSWLTREYCVLAIVGLPGGAVPGTSLQSNLVVFDRRRPPQDHETFIAQLGEDWAEQLAPQGGALSAYLSYLERFHKGSRP